MLIFLSDDDARQKCSHVRNSYYDQNLDLGYTIGGDDKTFACGKLPNTQKLSRIQRPRSMASCCNKPGISRCPNRREVPRKYMKECRRQLRG